MASASTPCRRPAHLQAGALLRHPHASEPIGATLPLDRRAQLVALSQEHGFLLVADEVYHLLATAPHHLRRWGAMPRAARPVHQLVFQDPRARPAAGLGAAAPDHIQRLVNSGLLDSGGGLNPFTSALVRVVLDKGLQDTYLAHLHDTSAPASPRWTMPCAASWRPGRTTRPRRAATSSGCGCPQGTTPRRCCRMPHAMRYGFRPGVRFSSRGELNNYLRLSFAFYEAAELAGRRPPPGEGSDRLCQQSLSSSRAALGGDAVLAGRDVPHGPPAGSTPPR